MTSQPQPEPASAAALAGLAREVEALRRTVESLPTLTKRVDNLAGLLGRLAQQLAAQKAAETDGPVSWLDLPADGSTTADELLAALTGWMAGVYLRYADAAAGLPGCWLWHPDIVEELLWLWQAWDAAYHGDNASISRVGDWHDRQRPGVTRRIKAAGSMCSIENHQPGHPQHAGPPAVPLTDAAPAIAGWWATRRTDPPPAPTADQLAAADLEAPARRGRT
jgi:hypothetical protein